MASKANSNPLASCMTETGTGFVMTLPASLPGETAAQVADAILAARGHPLRLVAGAVERIDTPCLQVLLSAACLWRDDGVTIGLAGPSPVLESNLRILGLSVADFETGDGIDA